MNAAVKIRLASERGVTLIELLVYMVLSSIVLMILGGLLVNSLTTQNAVRNAASATTAGQLIMRTIEDGVRNASAVRVNATGTLLVVRTSGSTADDWVCQAWFFNPADDGTVYMKQGASAAVLDTASAATNWTMLGERTAVGRSAIFDPVSTAPTRNPVTITLNLGADRSANVALTRTVQPRIAGTPAPGTCFS